MTVNGKGVPLVIYDISLKCLYASLSGAIVKNAFRMIDNELFKEYAFWASVLVGKARFKIFYQLNIFVQPIKTQLELDIFHTEN